MDAGALWIDGLGGRYDSSIRAVWQHLDRESDRLFDSDLKIAVAAGILTIRPIADEMPNQAHVVGEYFEGLQPDEYQVEGAFALADLLSDPTRICLLDPAIRQFAELLEPPSISVSDLAAEMGLSLIQGLPRLVNATVADILDMREGELKPPLVRFRAAMMTAAKDFQLDESDEISEFLSNFRTETLDPALAEIEETIQQDTYLRELLHTASDPVKLGLGAGALVLAAASGGALLAGALGLSGTALKAAESLRRKRAVARTNRFYLLHALGDRSTL